MFEGIKTATTLECVQGFVPKGWINVRQSKLTRYLSDEIDISIFENYLLIEFYSMYRHAKASFS